MPWQAPGVLDAETYWQLTTFLLRANDLNLGSEPLSPQNAAQVHLRGGVAGEFSVVGPETSPEDDIVATADNRFEVDRIWLGLFGIALAMLLLIGVVGLSFNRARRESHNPAEDQNKTE